MSKRLGTGQVLLGVAALGVIGVALWLTVLAPASEPSAPSTSRVPVSAADEALEKLPPSMKATPNEVTGAVRLAAERVGRSPAEVVRAVNAAAATDRLTRRDAMSDAPGAPRSASELAPVLTGKRVGKAGTLELTALAAGLIEARELGEVEFGYVAGWRRSATEVLARRYVLRVDGGRWLAPDDEPVESARVVALDEAGWLANVLAWRALGAMADNDRALATKAAGHARALAPDDPAVLFVSGKAQLVDGLTEMGVATMERAAAKQADALTWHTLGRVAAIDGRLFRADQYFRKALAADPAFAEPHLMLADLARDRLELTPQAEQPKLIEQAKAHAAKARAIDPNVVGLRVTEAHMAALEQDLERAERLLREEVALHASEEHGWLVLSQFLAVQERGDEALETMQNAVDAGVDSYDVVSTYGALLAASGRFDEALPVLEKALAKQPKGDEVRPQLAQLYRANERLDDARRMLIDHLELYADDATSRLLLAQLELESARYEEAFAAIKTILKTQPDHREARLLDYIAHLITDKPAGMARRKAVDALGSRSAVAQVLLEQGLAAESETLLEEALVEEPDDGLAPVLLVALYVATNREAKAQTLRDKTLASADESQRAALSALFDDAEAQGRQTKSALDGARAP